MEDEASAFQPLEDPAVDDTTLKELRAAYRELRAAYVDLHERHHERITEALAERKEDGKKTGGDVPYGYRLDSDNETLLEDKVEQSVIAEVVRLREQGFSLRRIVQELWKRKLRPRLGPRARKRGLLKTKRVGEFDPTQISRMIKAYKERLAEAQD
jgi:DNA invertase Pin-like site-specific DNA recombinase